MATHVIQFATGKYEEQLALTYLIHSKACQKYGYIFTVTNKQENPHHPYWEKPLLCRKAIQAGATQVVWLDADTLWTGDHPLDPPLTSIIGCTQHVGFNGPMNINKPQYTYDHYNAGVFYLDSSDKDKALQFIDNWYNEPDDNHQWHDQHSLNKLFIRDPGLVTKLDMRWNSVEHNPGYRSQDPVVRAWHGGGGPDRVLAAMKSTIKALGK